MTKYNHVVTTLNQCHKNVISYEVQLSVLEYQTAVMRKDFDTADSVLPNIPREQRTRVAHFLEKQGFKEPALHVTTDPEHKFELALSLGMMDQCYKLVEDNPSELKWKQLADLASKKADFKTAHKCYRQAGDLAGQLLLATSSGDQTSVHTLAEDAQAKGATNISFLASFISGESEKCLDLLISCNRIPEAAFFARTYFPSKVPQIVELWKKQLSTEYEQPKIADSLAGPSKYDNLFEDYQDSLNAEEFMQSSSRNQSSLLPSTEYVNQKLNENRNVFEEMEEVAEPEQEEEEEDEDQFEDADNMEHEREEKSDVSSPPEIITSEDVKNATPPEEENEEEDEEVDSESDDEDIDLDAEMEKLGVDDEDIGSDLEISE